jgi:hypothetical protein
MEIGRTPDQPAELPSEEPFEEAVSDSGSGKGGGELFGDSAIPPTLYHCPNHGDVLAQDVVWKQDGRPYCPECDAALDSE